MPTGLERHRRESTELLLLVAILILTILTMWVLKKRQVKFLHETGGAMLYGFILGLILKLAATPWKRGIGDIHECVNLNTTPQFLLVNVTDRIHEYYHVGEVTPKPQALPAGSILHKMAFNPEIFFNLLLPPIIFHGAYSLNQRRFFRNIGSVLTFAFIGTLLTCGIIGFCMLGFVQLMVRLGHIMDGDFSLRDCLLFGSLMSATDPAMQQVLDNLGDLPSSAGAKDIDLIFLRGIMESPVVRSLAKAHERLEDTKLEAVQDNNAELVSEILGDISGLSSRDDSAAELSRILKEPHFKSLLEAHDIVASKCYDSPPSSLGPDDNTAAMTSLPAQADAIRMIGIRKKAGEPLGVTFRVEKDELVIARILHGGMIDRQGLLHVGDVIKEVNGCDVGSNAAELQELLKESSGSVTLKILPSYRDAPAPAQVYVQPHFDYNPSKDSLIPCKEAGLAFSRGDILQIVNKDDPNWWQACHVVGGATGLVPSQYLEEKRKAFVPKDWDDSGILCGAMSGKKKKKMMYLMARNAEFDRHELLIYEEVTRMPPFQRKTLVLIGAQGVGRRSLKNRLVVLNPKRFGTTVPFTSRRPRNDERDGHSYRFVTRAEMEADIKAGQYLEHGEYDGNLYGTKIDSIHEVVETGQTCILDVNPQALKVLRTPEFMPYVVFIAAPELETLRLMHKAAVEAGLTGKLLTDMNLKKTVDESARIQRSYRHFFDLTIVNDNLDQAFEKLLAAVDRLATEPQWVPVSWVY